MSLPRALLLTFAATLAASAARANLIVNGSFESGPSPGEAMELAVGSTALPGWIVIGSPIDYVGTRWNAADGACSIGLNGTNPGGLSQTFDTVPGADYTVTFFMAGDAFSNPVFKHMRVAAAGQSQDYEFDATHAWPWGMGWLEHSFVFTASGSSSTLEFTSLDVGDTGPTLDSVVVTGQSPVSVGGITKAGLSLATPYPNPSSGGFTISYSVATATPVRVLVSDVRGRILHVLADGVHAAGPYVRQWDGRTTAGDARPGVYLITLVAPDATLVQKAIRIR